MQQPGSFRFNYEVLSSFLFQRLGGLLVSRASTKALVRMLFFVSALFVGTGQLSAQEIKSNQNIPALNACSDAQTVTVQVSGLASCTSPQLEIEIPQNFELDLGSVSVVVGSATVSEESVSGVKLTLDAIAGAQTITFGVRALCDAIPEEGDESPVINYTLTGCGTTLEAESEALNVIYAVLHPTVSPTVSSGIIGTNITRTITVTNNGNGSTRDFYVKRELGAHLLYVEVDPDEEFTADYPGWDIDSTTHAGYYRFSSSTVSLLNGQSISFDETVVISGGCADLSSTYTAYYVNPNITNPTLAASVCEKGSGDITTDVSFNASIKPRLEITKIQVGDIECLNGSDDEQIFKIENIGAGVADDIKLLLGTGGTGATYFDAASVQYSTTYSGLGTWSGGTSLPATPTETWAAEGGLYGTTGFAKQLSVAYPDELSSNDVVYIRVIQKHNTRSNPGTVLCEDLPPTVEFGNSWVEAEYNHPGDCNAPIESDRTTLRDNLRYAFAGVNMGEIDVIPGEPYLGDFALTEMIVDSEGIGAGGELTISVEFSPNLINTSGVTLVSYTGEPLATATGSGTTFSFTIPYDQAGSVWENYSINPRLDLRGARLQFSTDLECPSPYTGDTFFKVTTSLKRGASCPPIESACVTNLLANKCADGPCDDGGLTNGRARIIRTSLGETEANPYVNGLPNVGTTVDPTSPNVRVRAFTTNDILRISQEATAHPGDAMPADGWKTGNMTVTIPAGVEVEAVANSAQITVTRGGSTATATLNSATVDIVEDLSNPGGYVATMAFDVTDVTVISDVDGIFTSFTGLNDDGDDDNVLFSFEVKVINNGTDGLKEFGVISALTDDSGTPFLCGDTNPYTATGYYASGKLTFTQGGNGNITSCATDQRPKSVTLNYSLMNNQRNMLFPAEFKQAFFPKTAVFANISSGLQLNGVRLVLRGQGTFSGATIAPATIDIPTTNTAVFTSSTTFDIEAALALLQGTGPHLDEGFELQLFPIVGSTCSSNSTATMDVHVTYAGTVLDHSRGDDPTEIVSHVNDGDDGSGATVTEQLSYNTAAGALQAVAATPHTTIAVDKAQWVIQVSNSSTFRAMENVWLSKASGPLTITEIVPVDNYAGANPGTAITPTGGGIYGLGSLPTSTTRYYRITASTAADCADGAIVLNIGQACDGDLTNGCPMGSEPLTLQYTMGKPQIQARIVYQTTSTANLCDDFDYEIELNNAGNGAAKDITLTIPVVSASQFAYKTGSLEATVAYTGSTVPALADVSGTFTVVEGPSMIRVTIPNSHFGAGETLPAGSKINIKFTLLTAGCDFRSGQRIRFNAAANNICGNFPTTSSAASDRLNIGSATASAPVVVKDPSVSATVNSVIDPSGPLYATYNFQITNTTSNPYPLVGDPADPAASHRFSIKLPSGWTFVTALADLFPAEIAVYENDDAVRGHIFRLTSDVASGGSLELPLTSTQLRYTPGTPIADLTCTIGTIEESVYGLFTPPGVGSDPGDCMACALDQIFLESTTQITIEPEDPTVQSVQVFCAAENPRVSDLTAAGTNLRFYDSLGSTTPLAPTALLEVGSNNSATYYVTSSPIPNGACESDRKPITVYMPKASVSGNQSAVNATSFTVTAHAGIEQGPVSGRWSIVSVTGADLSEVGFGTAGTHTVAVTSATPTSVNTQTVVLPRGAEVLVRWTVTYHDCDSYAETTLHSTIKPIVAIDNYYPEVSSRPGTYNATGTTNTPLLSVLTNTGTGTPANGEDTLGGDPATTTTVTIIPGTPNHPNLTMGNDGRITVAQNTPAGNYQYPYTICEVENPTNCDNAVAYITVTPPTIDAVDDEGGNYGTPTTPINGYIGGNTPSVLVNDTLDGALVDPADVTLTPGDSPLPGNLTMNPDGTVTVAPGTPEGSYNYPYTICDKINPTICDDATATIIVGAAVIKANDNGVYNVNGATGNTNIANALIDDRLNGQPFTFDKVTTTVIDTERKDIGAADGTYATATGNVPQLDPETGVVSVPAGTLPGYYRITYSICENLNTTAPPTPGNCDQAYIWVQVDPTPIIASDNTYGPVKGNVGSDNLGNVLPNDIYNDHVPTTDNVRLTSPIAPPGTNSGDPQYPYIYTNTTDPSDPKIGTVIVPPGTPDDTYTIEYTICEAFNPTNCDTATITVTVSESTIDAIDDLYVEVSGRTTTTLPSVLGDDLLNGTVVDPSDITLTVVSTLPTGFTMSTDGSDKGEITVSAGTPAGVYHITYEICETLNTPPGNCDQAIATIIVTAADFEANNDTLGPVNGANSTVIDGSNNSIFDNDSYDGVVPIALSRFTDPTPELILSQVHGATPVRHGASIVPTLGLDPAAADFGFVTVPAGTAAGQYQITYKICEALNPTNCDDAIVTVLVEAAPIVAVNDTYPTINGKIGGTMPSSVVVNDTLNGDPLSSTDVNSFTPPAKLILRPGTRPHPSISMSGGGVITVAPNTPANTYQYPYTICEGLNPTNCASAVAIITVTAAPINAVNDSGADFNIANGHHGGTTASVLDNDQLNGTDINPTEIKLVPRAAVGPGASDASAYLVMNADGTITVRPSTPAGIYTYTYNICEVLNPTNCSTVAPDTDFATATIVVGGGTLVAVDDGAYTVLGVAGNPSVGNALTNDRLNGHPVTVGTVKITEPVEPTEILEGGTYVPATGTAPTLNPLTGNIAVPAGTPAGMYQINYEICEVLNPDHCDQATITINVTASSLIAVPNTYGPVKGAEGNTNLGNVLVNDIYNGSVPTSADVTVEIVTDATPIGSGPIPTISTSGQVSVPAGTPDGVYEITYGICEVASPANCSNTTTITITVGESSIDALDDTYGPINGKVGGTTAVANPIWKNDFLNGSLVNPAEVTVSVNSLGGSVLILNTNGTITVPANTPAGVYSIRYTICENLNPTNCDDALASVTVSAAPIDAINDNYSSTPVNGKNGDTLPTVLGNDLLNNVAVVAADVTLTPGASPLPGKITMKPNGDPNKGEVVVAPNTPAGTYIYTYRICEVLNPTNCDDAFATIVVEAAVIVTNDDDFAADPAYDFDGRAGGDLGGGSVLANDTFDGVLLPNVVPNAGDFLRLTPGARPHPNISMNLWGGITVAPNTPAGIYEYSYTVCEILNPTNCDNAMATIRVLAAAIMAVDDDFTTGNPTTPVSINGMTGGTTTSVMTNDLLNGGGFALSEVKLTPGSALDASSANASAYLVMNLDGTITVRPGTPAGTYTYSYDICEVLNPTNCTTTPGVATIEVTVATIIAAPDTFGPVNGATGSPNAGNALTNDLLNNQPVTLDKVKISTPVNPAIPSDGSNTTTILPELDANTGIVSVPPGTPADTYTITYEICETLNTSNCATNTITVEVVAAPVIANDNTFGPVKGDIGSTNLGNVLDNDIYNGRTATLADVTINPEAAEIESSAGSDTYIAASGDVPTINVTTGIVSVPAGTPDGKYRIEYEICEVLNTDNCDNAYVYVTVGSSTIDAVDDHYVRPINGKLGGTTHTSVLNNDFLNGTLVNPSEVTISNATLGTVVGVSLNTTTGYITVAPNTKAGVYSIRYQICENLNPTNCDFALATVVVTAAPIDAINDNYSPTPVNGRNGGTLPTVLSNDLLNNATVVAGDVTLLPGVSPHAGITMKQNGDPNKGEIVVAPNTPAGTYIYTYRICEVLNPTNCDDAFATIVVSAAPIVANDDEYTALPNGKTGSLLTEQFLNHILSNDQLNGSNLSLLQLLSGSITLTPGTRPHPNIIMDPLLNTGFLLVAPNTPAGRYAYPYTICETLNPTNCDHAVIYINVPAAPIDAVDDSGTDFDIANGHLGGRTASVLDNDRLNNTGVVPSEVKLTPGTVTGPAPAIGTVADYFAMNADGTITVRSGTPEGTYTYNYRICEILNISRLPIFGGQNCDNATATIIVGTGVIVANDDSGYTVNGATGNPSVGNALTNDLLNGVLATLDKVRITTPVSVAVPLNAANVTSVRPVLNPTTGIISVPAGTPANTYTIDYQICEILNPTNCADATIEVVVTTAPIVANDNTFGPIKGHIGTLNLGSVLTNDTFNGNVVTLGTGIGNVSLTWNVDASGAPVAITGPAAGIPNIQLNPDGTISVLEGIQDGTYEVIYRICDNINVSPVNCDDAVVRITIGSATIDAQDDYYTGPINGMVGGTTFPLSVFRNDFLNGTLLNPADVTLTWDIPFVGGTSPTVNASAYFTLDATNGFITVAPFTPEGDYVIPYTICENVNPTTNCDNAIVIIRVGAAPIKAVNDTYGPVNGHTGGTVDNVLDNDTLNGDPAVVGTANGQVTIHEVHPATPVRPGENIPVLNTTTGEITVPARTPEGEYQISYRICEVLNPTNCDDAIVTVVVHEAPIVANDDVYVALPNGMVGSTMLLQQVLAPVLSNDTFNGNPITLAQLADGTITLTPGTRPHPNIIMESTLTGSLIVLPNTPAGVYAYPYTICEVLNPTNCDNAVIYITVPATGINAVNDNFVPSPINGMTGGKTASVLDNDEFVHVPLPFGLSIKEAVAANLVKLVPGASSAPQYLTMNADGTISVKPGTPEGNYWYDYQICEILNNNMVTGPNCDNARATIRVIHATIFADNDNFGPVNGASGSLSVGNAFTNDKLNGVPFTADLVTATQVGTVTSLNGDNPLAVGKVPAFDPATGIVSVPAGTPADTYTIRYEICELLNPTNCDEADIVINVTAAPIVAVPDTYGPVKGNIGTLNLGNVLGNDSFNGQAAVLGAGISHVTITDIVPAISMPGATVPEVPYMTNTGQVFVPQATPDGVYTITYTICDNINVAPMPSNCSTTVVTITVGNATIDAIDDSNAAEPINGRVGGTTRSVLDNDFLNGTLVNKDINGNIVDPLTNVQLTWNVDLAGAPVTIAGPALGVGNIHPQTDGTIVVDEDTPEGTYLVTYRICELINLDNCDIAIAKVVVIKSDIDAIPDLYTDVDGKAGATLPTVLNNDLLDFEPIMPDYWADVTLTPGASPHPGITMKDNSHGAQKGEIVVAPETPAGKYTYAYRICEVLNPLNCDDAEATIMVVVPRLEAFDDNYCATPINSYTGGVLSPSVLANDLLNGVPVLRSEVFFEPSTSPHANISMDSNGVITVGPKTPAGEYRFTYQICEVVNPTNCDIGEATICVVWPDIEAIDDDFGPINSSAGGTTVTVLHNDLLNGALVKPSEVKIIPQVSSDPANIIMNADGTILVRPGTKEGTYTHTYRICEVVNPDNCDDATATITVTAAPILVGDDTFCSTPINGKSGGTTVTTIFANDRLNGLIVIPTAVDLTPLVATGPGGADASAYLSINNNGTITVAPETPAGTYTYTYQICEVNNPNNCATGTATICVREAVIDAIYDNFLSIPIIGKTGGTTALSVLDNDLLNNHPVKRDEVILTPLVATGPGGADASAYLTMNLDGTITVAPETPEGTYEYTYRICEVLNPTNCDEDKAVIVVIKASIEAVEDIYIDRPINGKDGGTTTSVLNNDRLNGKILDPADVILTPRRDLSPGLPGSITMNPTTGIITVAPETRAGTYVYRYEICEVINPTNCDQTDVTILVVAPKIEAINDYPAEISGYTGGTTTLSVLDNDLLNGVILDPADVNLFPLVAPHVGITMNADGTVTVAAGVPVGTYPYPYRICEVLNPTNCAMGTAFIKVVRAGIVANDDTPDSINGKVGGKTPSVLDNDLLNGNPIDPSEIKLLPGVPTHPGLVMNPDGTITVAPETKAGTYLYPYEICEVLNPNNCDNAVVTVTVDAAQIEAIDDDFSSQAIYGRRGATTVGSVLENDLLNGRLVLPREVTLTPSTTRPHPNIQMNSDGTITVAANTPEGVYKYPYEICEVLNPTNCDNAEATVVVLKTEIFALDDVMDIQNTRTGAVSDGSVLTNDQLNNLPLVDGEFTLHPGTPSDPGLTMNPDGTISVAPGMKPGTYTYPYTICEVLNSTNCASAVAIVRVIAPELIIPNVFTPNDDNKNQYFEIIGLEGYDYIELTVVNRWGNVVFKNDRYDNKWDGKDVNEGTYFYIIRAMKDGHSTLHKGYVTIKRY